MGSPLQSWESVEAYFTFADKPFVVVILLLAAVAVTLGAVIYGAAHETEAYKKLGD